MFVRGLNCIIFLILSKDFYSSIFLLFYLLLSFHALSFSSTFKMSQFPIFVFSHSPILSATSYYSSQSSSPLYLLSRAFVFHSLWFFTISRPVLLCHHLPCAILLTSLLSLSTPCVPTLHPLHPPNEYIPPVARCWRSTSLQGYTSWALSAGSWPFACSSSSPSSTSASGRESRRLER